MEDDTGFVKVKTKLDSTNNNDESNSETKLPAKKQRERVASDGLRGAIPVQCNADGNKKHHKRP